jgi:BASS family bile acid:Na+ symporter
LFARALWRFAAGLTFGAMDASTILLVTKTFARIAIPLVAFSVGLGAASAELTWLLRERSLMLRSLLATLVIVPVLTIAMVLSVRLPPEIRQGLIITSLSIGPVVALRRTAKAAGDMSYALGLDLLLLALSVVYVPGAVAILAAAFHRALQVSVSAVAVPVFFIQLLPLVAGVVLARIAPRVSERIARPVTIVANVLFALLVLLVLALTWRGVVGIGLVGFIASASVALMAIVIGHALGGPLPETRRVLATFCAVKFPLLAFLIAMASPLGKRLLPVVLAYLLVSAIFVAVYGAISKAARGGRAAPARPAPTGAA